MHFRFSYFVVVTVTAVFAFSCSQNKIKQEPLNEPPKKIEHRVQVKPKGELQLTFHGKNSQPSFSPNGDRIVYISQNRYQHTNAQVYQLSLDTLQSDRVTYQDGQADSPIYSDRGASIIYASTTDEIKENPLFIHNRLQSMNQVMERGLASQAHSGSDLHPFELYKKNLLSDQFIRLTRTPFLDKNASIHTFKNQRLFTSVRNGNLEIYSYRPNLPNSPIRLTFNDLTDDEAQYSPTSMEFVWVRYGLRSDYSQIMFSQRFKKDKKELSFGAHYHINPKWHSNGEYIYYSATSDKHKNFQLYTMNKDGSCKTRLTFNNKSDTQPAIDPKSNYIVFTRNKNIYRMDLKEPKCSET